MDLRLSTPVQSVELDRRGVAVTTPAGAIHARAAVVTVSTAVPGRGCNQAAAASGRMASRRGAPSRSAATRSLFLEIVGENSFVPETRVIGDPRDRRTGVYHIRPVRPGP